MMEKKSDTRDGAKRRAQNHFAASEQRDVLVRQEIERERNAVNARIAKQRAARLAKEADDQSQADALGALFPVQPKKTKKRAKTGA